MAGLWADWTGCQQSPERLRTDASSPLLTPWNPAAPSPPWWTTTAGSPCGKAINRLRQVKALYMFLYDDSRSLNLFFANKVLQLQIFYSSCRLELRILMLLLMTMTCLPGIWMFYLTYTNLQQWWCFDWQYHFLEGQSFCFLWWLYFFKQLCFFQRHLHCLLHWYFLLALVDVLTSHEGIVSTFDGSDNLSTHWFLHTVTAFYL